MKAIHADPKEIRKVFAEKYVIPDFQRPYSWEVEECDKLWDDLLTFYNDNSSQEEKYFLGNIVIHNQGEAFAVIDGQQRLTTLLILIKALYQKAGTVKALEECLKTKNPLTSELTNELRVNSQVLANDKIYLHDIIFNNGKNTPNDSKLKCNYEFLNAKITEWWQSENQSTEKLEKFILTLLDNAVLLPIHCGSEDDALTIFETINNRGKSLTDADIFKAKLYHSAKESKDEFIEKWNELKEHEWLFRIYAHVLRAIEGDVSKESGLRSYYTEKGKNRLADWKSVMKSITKIYEVEEYWQANDDVNILWNILYTYPNYYWNFPLHVFLHKYGNLDDSGFSLPEKHSKEFIILITETVKYFFLKGVVHNSVNSVKDTVFKVCALIESNGNYLDEYKKNSEGDLQEFERRIINKQYGRYLRGLVLLASYLNPKQAKKDLIKVILDGYHIEHVLPKKWNNYDRWAKETWESNLNTLGNLIPLEWNLNISAKNEFFDKKKEHYMESGVQDAKDLTKVSEWYPEQLDIAHNTKHKRLMAFFN